MAPFRSLGMLSSSTNQRLLLLITYLLVVRYTDAISGTREHFSSKRKYTLAPSLKKNLRKSERQSSIRTRLSSTLVGGNDLAIDKSLRTNQNLDHAGDQATNKPRLWPCLDELDQRLISISLPVIANFAIGPLIGAIDLFWVNRMGNALAVAGQSAANQVFNSAFMLASFLPSVTATLVSKQNASGNKAGVEDAVCHALFVGLVIAAIGTPLLCLNPSNALGSVFKGDAPALQYAIPYLVIRSLTFLPSLVSFVGFSAFRGILETDLPVKISLYSNIVHAALDPIFMFSLSMGVPGAALATLIAEIMAAGMYLIMMHRRQMISWSKMFRLPSWLALQPLLSGGLALQLRNVAFNLTFLGVARVTQSIDESGVSAAAHAMTLQVFQVGGIFLLALSVVAQTVVPNELVERFDAKKGRIVGGVQAAKATVNRLMCWGFILGAVLGALQIALLPLICKSTPILAVREAAVVPSYLASIFQMVNGLVFVGEGVMIGCGNFMQVSLSTVIASAGCLWALYTFPPVYGLSGVWMAFGVFNTLRLAGVLWYQFRSGPFASRNML